MTTLLPVSAEAASFSSGAPATVLLFRGAGGLLGPLDIRSSSQSGIDALASRIDSEFSDSMLTVRTFDSYEGDIFSLSEVGSSQGTAFAKQIADSSAGETGALGLVGYSGGGLSAIRTAKNLSPNPVDLLVQIESYEPLTGRSPEDEVLPDNVRTGINYYQLRNRFSLFRPDWDPTDLQGATDVKGANNINAEALFDDRSLTHQNIIDDLRLQDRIVQDIQENLLGDRTFALSAALWAPLMLGDTVSDRPLASSNTAYNAEAVPEPGLLLAIGLLGGGLWVTRKTEQ
ncbi:MAG: hypothetical protein WBC73_08975 [Phormidesmis sp.]